MTFSRSPSTDGAGAGTGAGVGALKNKNLLSVTGVGDVTILHIYCRPNNLSARRSDNDKAGRQK